MKVWTLILFMNWRVIISLNPSHRAHNVSRHISNVVSSFGFPLEAAGESWKVINDQIYFSWAIIWGEAKGSSKGDSAITSIGNRDPEVAFPLLLCFFSLCMCVHMHTCHVMSIEVWEKKKQEFISSFHAVDSGVLIQVISLVSKHYYLWNHLTGPEALFFRNNWLWLGLY